MYRYIVELSVFTEPNRERDNPEFEKHIPNICIYLTDFSWTQQIRQRQNVNSNIVEIKSWSDENHMLINEKKTEFIVIGTRQRLSRLQCQKLSRNVYNIAIDSVDNEKLLGMRIDNS